MAEAYLSLPISEQRTILVFNQIGGLSFLKFLPILAAPSRIFSEDVTLYIQLKESHNKLACLPRPTAQKSWWYEALLFASFYGKN